MCVTSKFWIDVAEWCRNSTTRDEVYLKKCEEIGVFFFQQNHSLETSKVRFNPKHLTVFLLLLWGSLKLLSVMLHLNENGTFLKTLFCWVLQHSFVLQVYIKSTTLLPLILSNILPKIFLEWTTFVLVASLSCYPRKSAQALCHWLHVSLPYILHDCCLSWQDTVNYLLKVSRKLTEFIARGS